MTETRWPLVNPDAEYSVWATRQRAKDKLGPRFDQRVFHDVILRHGAVPLDVLETQVEQWIAEKQQ